MDHTISAPTSWFEGPTAPASPNARFVRLSLTLLGLVALADWLFYEQRPGVSITVYGCAAVACLLVHRPAGEWTLGRVGILVLIAGALVESAIDFNFFNFVVLGMLMSAAMMDEGARACGAGETVWPLAAAAVLRALGRWVSFAEVGSRVAVPASLRPFAERSVRILFPAILVALPLLALLASGNVLLGSQVRPVLEGFERWIRSLHLPSPVRILFWLLVATGSLTYLHPYVDRRVARLCHEKWKTFAACDDRPVGLWRSLIILAIMNGLLFWANSIDALFLWMRRAPPPFHSYSQYLHEGTLALTTTTLFAAAVLVVLFQQASEVTRRPWIRSLALACVAQNLFLISSVALRLKLYVEAYQLTVLRVHVVTFLVVVACGYGLFAWRILFGRSLNWLVFANAAAVLALFYAVQFADVPGFVAEYNTSRWLDGRSKTLDLGYLKSLGVPALPQFARLQVEAPGTAKARLAETYLRGHECRKSSPERPITWRSWQWRTASIENRLFAKR